MVREIVTDKERLSLPSNKIHDTEVISQVVQDMIDTANHYRGKPIGCVGLASNQIGELHRIIIVWYENDWLVMINPEVTVIKGKSGYMTEGCLSRPGVKAKLKRHKKVMVAYFDQNGDLIEQKFTGFVARVVQHEQNHLDGIYI